MDRRTFVNKLTVPRTRRDEFLRKWDLGAEFVRSRPGLVWTSLHESVAGGDRATFFTIAVWESEADFRNAVSTDWWAGYVQDFGFGEGALDFQAAPDLCEVVRDGGPFGAPAA